MVYSPSSNKPKSFSHTGKSPQVVTDDIDAGAIRLQAPKIRPVTSRKTQPLKRRNTTDGARPANPMLRATSQDMTAYQAPQAEDNGLGAVTQVDLVNPFSNVTPFDFRSAATLVDFGIRRGNVVPISDQAVAELLAELDEFVVQEQEEVRSVITTWETPYNRPAFSTPENIQYTRLAAQYLQQGRIEDAERLYKQALVVAERTFREGDPAIFRAIEDLAGFYYRHEKYQQAEPLVARLLRYRVERLSPDDWLLIRTVDQLSEIYEKCGESVHAQALYKLLLARQEDAFGRNSPVCAFTLSRLADSYIRHQHHGAAESLMLTILEIQEEVHGECSLEIGTTLQELATIYHKLRRYDKAAEMLERLLEVLQTIHGENGLAVASCLLRLADLLTEVDMPREAEPLYKRAQKIYTLSYGDRTAAHSVFKKKFDRISGPLSKSSKDKPSDQEECWRFPAIKLTFDDLELSRSGEVSRCLDQGVEAFDEIGTMNIDRSAIKTHVDLQPLVANNSYDSQLDTQEFDFPSTLLTQAFVPIPTETLEEDVFKPVFENSAPQKFAGKTKKLDTKIENFLPDPSSNLDSILDPLFVTELTQRYETIQELPIDASKTVEFPIDISGSFKLPIEVSGTVELRNFDKTTEIIQLEKQKITLAMRVPGLVTVSQADSRKQNRARNANSATRDAVPRDEMPTSSRKASVAQAFDQSISFAPDFGSEATTAIDQRETVKEKPQLLPEPFPSSRKKKTQTMFPVSSPSRARV
jgi:tetratricopeptide (TPR) repeat protein